MLWIIFFSFYYIVMVPFVQKFYTFYFKDLYTVCNSFRILFSGNVTQVIIFKILSIIITTPKRIQAVYGRILFCVQSIVIPIFLLNAFNTLMISSDTVIINFLLYYNFTIKKTQCTASLTLLITLLYFL